jgi:ubiquitin fusion degradation protein 1
MGFEVLNNLGPYNRQLKCFSVAMMGGKVRHDVDKGGKSNLFSLYFNNLRTKLFSCIKLLVILPASALDHLTRLHIEFPMLFKLTNRPKNRATHCGVLEFVAEEGRCYLPFWVCYFILIK